MSGPAEMKPEDVPDELIDLAFKAAYGTRPEPGHDRAAIARALAAVLPMRDAAWLREAGGAVTAIVRVRALHTAVHYAGHPICAHCSGWNGVRCLGLMQAYPCPTIIEGKPAGVTS